MKRDVIVVDEAKCNGCGVCIPNCPEGALQIINGKVRLISDLFCDGLGACIGHCPTGAISIEQREAKPYDETKVMANVVKGGRDVIAAHLAHLNEHGQAEYLRQAVDYLRRHRIDVPAHEKAPAEEPCGCPGSRTMTIERPGTRHPADDAPAPIASELRQWPVQLHLLNPDAPYFRDADLAVVADCVSFAFADFHRIFLKDKALAIFCPKLDRSNDAYIDKLAQIFKNHAVRSVSVIHMEVPCCFGVEAIVRQALERSGKDIAVKEYTVSIGGEIV